MTDDKFAEALIQTSQNSLENDKALLKLGEALTDKLHLHSQRLEMMQQMITNLHKQVHDLYQKMDILAEIVQTHFTDTKEEEIH